MCIVYNSIGCLTTIKSHLRQHNVNDFHSVSELLTFQKDYNVIRQEIISKHSRIIEEEKNLLCEEINQLRDIITIKKREAEQQLYAELEYLDHQLNSLPSTHATIFHAFVAGIKRRQVRRKIRVSNLSFSSRIKAALSQTTDVLEIKSKRYQFIVSRFDDAVRQSSLPQLKLLDRKRNIIDQVSFLIYGALGEQKVVRELEHLPDDYILINDFNCSFIPALYNPQGKEYIKSIQADHLLITPSGIFLIETKNWSESSLKNYSLRSPVEQVKRTNYALYKMLAGDIVDSGLILNRHHWGHKKVPIRNLVVLTNQRPKEEFQFVKILRLNELLRYVKYFEPIFSNGETQRIADYLLNLNGKSSKVTKAQVR